VNLDVELLFDYLQMRVLFPGQQLKQPVIIERKLDGDPL
jgi:hypothetical protein